MDWLGILAWGLCATAAMTIIESLGLWMGLTRMSTPVILGTVITPDRDRAALVGTMIHLVIGWAFTLVYAMIFEAAGFATWWLGALVGIGHELFMAGVILPVLPAAHPRMASERHGPTPTRSLQPPGFMTINYGHRTLLVGLASHALFGMMLGALYRVHP